MSNQYPSNPMMRALAAGIRANVPTLIWGSPGTTKSATIESHAAVWGMECETVVASIRDATDFLGLPMEVDGGVSYAPPQWALRLAKAKKGLAFIDEITTGGEATEKALLRVIQERWVGELKLPDTVRFVAAANPPEEAVGGQELSAPMANRFMHLDWHFDADTWRNGLIAGFDNVPVPSLESMTAAGTVEDRARAMALVSAFTSVNEGLLNPGVPDNDAAGRAYPSPRAWTNLARVLTFVKRDDRAAILLASSGLVGSGAAIEFTRWMESAGLYDVTKVLDDPSIVSWTSDRPDTLYVLLQSIVAVAIGKGDGPTYEKAFAVCVSAHDAGRKDVIIPALMELGSRKPASVGVPSVLRPLLADTIQAQFTVRSVA